MNARRLGCVHSSRRYLDERSPTLKNFAKMVQNLAEPEQQD
jgi:hypothetical protein